MKKVLIVIVIIVLAVLGYKLFTKSPSSTDTTPTTTETTTTTTTTTGSTNVTETKTDANLLKRLGSSSVSVSEDGSKVALNNGSATFSVADTNAKSTVSVGTTASTKTFGTRNDVIAILNLSSGGVVSQYLVLFQDMGGSLSQKSIAYLGQGLDVRGITVADLGPNSGEDYVVSVSALTQKPNTTATFIMPVKDGAFDTAKAVSF